MIKRLSHIGIAVQELDSAIELFGRLFDIKDVRKETVKDQLVRVAFFRLGESSVELTAATAADSPIAKYIANRGEGVHHLSFDVDDIKGEISRLKSKGFVMIDDVPRVGAGGCWIAFLHPKSTNGVLIEISQKSDAHT